MIPEPARDSRSLLVRVAILAVTPRRWPEIARGLLHLATNGMTTRFFRRVHAYSSYLRSFARRRTDFVEERWTGEQELATAAKIAVFNHYDPRGVLHDFVAHYVRQLTEAGFTVIFVSNSPVLPRETVERLLPLCALILRRANVGYDFGALKDGIAQIPSLDRLEALLLANDSVYGPFRELKDVIARMDQRADVWGITDSWQTRFHVQSFFLLFNKVALTSAAFSRFWSTLRYVQAKNWIIEKYEIGLTQALEAGGVRCRALFPYRRMAAALLERVESASPVPVDDLDPTQKVYFHHLRESARRGVPLNGTHYYWDYLIDRMGCPFLKRDLLRANPERIPGIRWWEEVVSSASSYDTGLIARHLALTLRGDGIPDPLPAGSRRWSWYQLTDACDPLHSRAPEPPRQPRDRAS